MGADERGNENERPIKNGQKEHRADESTDDENEPVVGGILHEKGRDQSDRQTPPGQKPRDADGELLQEKREQRADESKDESKTEREERGRLIGEMRGDLDTRGKADRGDAQPKKPPSKEKNDDADHAADDGDG